LVQERNNLDVSDLEISMGDITRAEEAVNRRLNDEHKTPVKADYEEAIDIQARKRENLQAQFDELESDLDDKMEHGLVTRHD